MLLFSINRSRWYENPSLNIIVIDLYSNGGFPLEEAHEHCFQIQSVICIVILISFQCYCGECSGYIVVILPLLAFYFYSAYILYMVYYKNRLDQEVSELYSWCWTLSERKSFPSSLSHLNRAARTPDNLPLQPVFNSISER
jgi:hypothetical protein